MENLNFISDLKKDIINNLSDYEGARVYGCDLACKLFEGINAGGSVLYSTHKTKEFVKSNFDLFGALVEYCKDNMDITLNPFSEPEKAHVILVLEASKSVLSRVDYVDKKWDDEFVLTKSVIKTLIKQIKALDIEESDLF